MIRLSKIRIKKLSNDQINKIIFDNILDNNENSEIALVFGSYNFIEERVSAVVSLYKSNRIKKIIFMGGNKGISNKKKEKITEAEKMRDLAIKMGIPNNDIIIENKSRSTIDNCKKVKLILNNLYGLDNINHLTLVSSHFHLLRCFLLCKRYLPNHINYTLAHSNNDVYNKKNWYKTEEGRNTIYTELRLLVIYAFIKLIDNINIKI